MASDESSKPMFYTSTYRMVVDEKRRLQVPKKWRPKDLSEELGIIVWKTPDQKEACLLVLPPEPFGDLVNKIKAMPYSDPKAESLRRWLGKNTFTVALDKVGRVCLPDWMLTEGGLKSGGEAVVVGLMDRWQIWSPDRWEPRSALDDEMQEEVMHLI